MSGTEIAYRCPRSPSMWTTALVLSAICLRARYALSGTDIAYAATPVRFLPARNFPPPVGP
eukprot:1874619-Rhodomonas_salina.4